MAGEKPKQPFLKRGVGTKARLTATQRKKYVPKGGFVIDAGGEESNSILASVDMLAQDSTPNLTPQTRQLGQTSQIWSQQPPQAAAAANITVDHQAQADGDMSTSSNSVSHNSAYPETAGMHTAKTLSVGFQPGQDDWQPDAEPLDDVLEMQSQTELVMGKHKESLSNGGASAGKHSRPLPAGAHPLEAQEVTFLHMKVSKAFCQASGD